MEVRLYLLLTSLHSINSSKPPLDKNKAQFSGVSSENKENALGPGQTTRKAMRDEKKTVFKTL